LTWTQKNSGFPTTGGSWRKFAVSPNFKIDGTIYVGSNVGMFRSTDYGETWSRIDNGLGAGAANPPYPDITSVVISPDFANDNTLFVLNYTQGIFKSTDRGNSWACVSNSITIGELAISPNYVNDGMLAVQKDSSAGEFVIISRDRGASWDEQLPDVPISPLYLTRIAFSPNFATDQTIFVGTSGGSSTYQLDGIYAYTFGAPPNNPPTANAGPDQTVHVGNMVTLNGSGNDPDPDDFIAAYYWTMVSKPQDSGATLSDPAAPNPSFLLDKEGQYVLHLVVTDSYGAQSASDEVIISTQNSAPIANAGPDQTITSLGTEVHLDGTASIDADGDPLSYQWTLISKPPESTAALNEPTTARPTFTPDKYGTYEVQLVVNDGWRDSNVDTVVITFENVRPVAHAGSDQSIILVGSTVTLDGSGSSDANGDQLFYQWSLISIPAGSEATLSYSVAVRPTFVADVHGDYVAQLIVSDGLLESNPASVKISFENVSPVAAAGEDIAVEFYHTTVTLDGSQSYDDNGDDLTYAWSFTLKPEDSSATLDGADTATPSFVVDKHGDYIVQLTVSDGFGGTGTDTVTVSFDNLPPVADAGSGGAFPVGQTVDLDGSKSSDPNNDPLTYTWSLLSCPAGSSASIADSSAQVTSMTLDVKGDYQVQLVVNDGEENSPPTVISFTAILDTQVVIVAIQELQQDTIANLESSAFKNATMKNTVINKLSSVAANIEAGNYQEALGQLQHDLLAKTDGCTNSGAPDKNDWIKDCENQKVVYPELLRIIDLVQQLMEP
jgi:hypothetical protein